MPNDTETPEETQEETPAPTAAEVAAAEKAAAAEARAAAAEAEAERLKAKSVIAAKKSYGLNDWSDADWAAAEAETGRDRKALLADINLRAGISHQTNEAIESMRAVQAVRDELQEALDADPLSSKFKTAAKAFLADIPTEVVAKDPKKWVAKAMAYGKSQVKLPTDKRKPDNMDTRETGNLKDKSADKGFSVEEREVIESHGKNVEDYEKIKHPYIPDGTIHRSYDEAPKFGPK